MDSSASQLVDQHRGRKVQGLMGDTDCGDQAPWSYNPACVPKGPLQGTLEPVELIIERIEKSDVSKLHAFQTG